MSSDEILTIRDVRPAEDRREDVHDGAGRRPVGLQGAGFRRSDIDAWISNRPHERLRLLVVGVALDLHVDLVHASGSTAQSMYSESVRFS